MASTSQRPELQQGSPGPLRVWIASNFEMVATSLKDTLQRDPEIQFVACSRYDDSNFLRQIAAQEITCVLIDPVDPDSRSLRAGLELIKTLQERFPLLYIIGHSSGPANLGVST